MSDWDSLFDRQLTFTNVNEAQSYLAEEFYKKIVQDKAIRYLDKTHKGFTRLSRGDSIPVGRAGRTEVTLMLEKRKLEKCFQSYKWWYRIY